MSVDVSAEQSAVLSTDAPGRVVTREVRFPHDVSRLARQLGESTGWCWLDGGFVDENDDATWSYLGVATEIQTATRGQESEFLSDITRTGRTGSGTGFNGGWVVALGYEFGVALMGLDPEPDTEPPAFALRIPVVLALNHRMATAELRGPTDDSLDNWLDAYGDALNAASDPTDEKEYVSSPNAATSVNWRQSDTAYAANVASCRKHITDGDAYVLCLTDTAESHGDFDPLTLFLRLRAQGGATRGGLIVAGDRALVSASPEQFLSVRGDTVTTHPIKGTSPRGETPDTDAALARELARDPKERAENLMIVDLMRNDLSRVSEVGSVRVHGFLRVETHTHVHQLVSTVSGRLREGLGVGDVITSCFPGGSMTGAPKRRAVEILHERERAPRGLYSGCFGWIDVGGDAELAMSIRSIELRGSGARALIGAGGGITIDSDPEHELDEKHLKAAPLRAALRA